MSERVKEKRDVREKATHSTRTETVTPDGRTVIAREHNTLAPHPHPTQGGRLVTTNGINKLLVEAEDALADGVELYECDECGRTFDTAVSCRGHLTSHNSNATAPYYDIKTMKTLVAVVAKYRTARVRGFCEKAAEELNTIGVKMRDGRPWNPSQVSHAYNDWKDRPEVKRARRASTVPLVDGKPLPPPTSTTRAVKTAVKATITRRERVIVSTSRERIAQTLRDATTALNDISKALLDVIPALDAFTTSITPKELAELRAKAERYDDIQRALRGVTERS